MVYRLRFYGIIGSADYNFMILRTRIFFGRFFGRFFVFTEANLFFSSLFVMPYVFVCLKVLFSFFDKIIDNSRSRF